MLQKVIFDMSDDCDESLVKNILSSVMGQKEVHWDDIGGLCHVKQQLKVVIGQNL